MSGSRPHHLQLRAGIYHFRVRVPADLRVLVGLREIRRSLRVSSLSQARPLALKLTARVMELFDVARTGTLTREQVIRLSQACFADLAADVESGFTPRTDAPEQEIDEQLELWDRLAREVKGQLEIRRFDVPVAGVARRHVSRAGLDWESLTSPDQLDLMTGVARAMLEQHRLFLFRMEEQLLAYTPRDALFRGPLPSSPAPIEIAPSEQPFGPSLGDVAAEYIEKHRRVWTTKTRTARTTRLGYLLEHLGSDRPIASVTPANLRSFADAICRLRATRPGQTTRSFLARQTDNHEHRITPATAVLNYESTQAFFRWAKEKRGYIDANPAADVRLDLPKGPKAAKARRPFTPEEIETLFRSPAFTGCKSRSRRFEPGSLVIKDGRYWIPILGFYTGARLGELVQLHLADVSAAGPIPYLTITDAEAGEPGTDHHKSVKSQAGVRRVPLHSELMALGFGEFVEARRQAKRSSKRLFWEIALGADGQASTTFSKWFARLLDSVGLSDRSLVFHSFRHGAEDAFRNALLPQQVIDRIIGHSDGATSAGYGEGVWLETAAEAVRVMKLRACLPDLLRPQEQKIRSS